MTTKSTQAFTITLNSLANNSNRQSTSVTPSTQDDHRVQLTVDGNSASNTGRVEVYVGAKVGSVWDGGLSGTDGSFTGRLEDLVPLFSFNMNGTTAVTKSSPLSVAEALGFLPAEYAIVVRNASGDSLNSTGNSAQAEAVTY